MKACWVAVAQLVLTVSARSQELPDSRWGAGVTFDLLPVVVSLSEGDAGGAVQGWVGQNHWKARLVGARLTMPENMGISDGFERHRLQVIAGLVDYTFGESFDGFWVGGGLELWNNELLHSGTGQKVNWQETMVTLGGGYILYFGRFEVNPWAAVHLSLNPGDVGVNGDRYTSERLSAEASLKLGWRFR